MKNWLHDLAIKRIFIMFFSMICILVSGCSNNETETTADDSEQYNESTSSTETSDDATSEASDYVDEDESLQYAYIGGLDDAMELVEAIQDKISAEDLVGISYVEYEFLYHAIDLRFYDENGYVVKQRQIGMIQIPTKFM